jgi:hypothetical protein
MVAAILIAEWLQKGGTQSPKERKERQIRDESFAPLRLGVSFVAFFQSTQS